MNRVRNDRREPGETWAHYIKRGIGEENFDRLNNISSSCILDLESAFIKQGIYFGVNEGIDMEYQDGVRSLAQLKPSTYVMIGRDNPEQGEPETIAFVYIYPDNRVEISEYDPAVIPPDAKASFEQYRKEEDLQALADDFVRYAKGLFVGRI